MAAILKMATKTKFACKNYKSSFSKKNSGLFQLPKYISFIDKKFLKKDGAVFNMEIFLASFSRSSHIRQEF
jgi:hypothetical protein